MLTLKDCLDYSNLTEDEIAVIAAHEHLPYPLVVELACSLAQTAEGEALLRSLLKAAVRDARSAHDQTALEAARLALEQFSRDHPTRGAAH